MRDILLIAIVATCSVTAVVRPVVGILCFVWLAYLAPQGMTWGPARVLPLSQFVAIGTLTGFMISKEKKRIPLTRESILLFVLWVLFCLSTYFAIYHYTARASLISISKMLIMVFVCTALVHDDNKLLFLFRIISLSLGFYAVKGGIFAIRTGGTDVVWGPEYSWLGANNSIGLALSMNIPILYYLLKIDSNKWLRWIYRIAIVLSYPAIVCTFSRGAWLGMGIATVLILIRHDRKLLLIPAIAIFSIILFISLKPPERVAGRYEEFVDYEHEGSAQSRFWNWEMCRRVGDANPVFGAGFEFYSYEVIERYYPEFHVVNPGKVWNCHSIWYSIFAEHGYPGIILWISLLASCLISLRQIRSHGRRQHDKSIYIYYANMIEGALIAYMIVGTFINAQYYDILYWLIAVIIIIKYEIQKNAKSERSVLETPVMNPAVFTK